MVSVQGPGPLTAVGIAGDSQVTLGRGQAWGVEGDSSHRDVRDGGRNRTCWGAGSWGRSSPLTKTWLWDETP